MKNLLAMNMALLEQAILLVRDQPEGQFTNSCKEVFSSTIGQHVRHCVEHYEEFLLAFHEGRNLDYEKRPRDLRLETDTGEALRRLTAIHASLGELPDAASHSLGVLDTGATAPSPSSAAREMQYLLSHTVHHFALIAVIAGLGGISVTSDFGVAPSTLKHRANA
jgi:uncharacterized damage-inducible protein DinB